MESVKLAICIPTFNRPKVIEEFIMGYLERYVRYGFDIFIYDSSENAETESVVRQGMKQYATLHLIKVDPAVHSNMKVYNIFREFANRADYDYLWVCADALRWSERILSAVSSSIRQEYDMIIPNYRDVEKIGIKEYTDKNVLFLDCAWHMTLYGATILKISTMLQDVPWDKLIEKYMISECINHSHVAFYFEKLNMMSNWKAIHLSFDMSDLVASSLKKNSGWREETFYVWCHCWPTMINRLPETYKNKNEVIRKSGINSTILSYENLRNLKKDGFFNYQIYDQYKRDWRSLTDIPPVVIWFLAVVPIWIIKCEEAFTNGLYWRRLKEEILKLKIKLFCYRFKKIYVYGAGKKAKRYAGYLNDMGIKFEGYLVTSRNGNQEMINNHPVFLFSLDLLKDSENGILLALNQKNTEEVLERIQNVVDRKIIFNEFKRNHILWR